MQHADALNLSDQILVCVRQAGQKIPLQYWRDFERAWLRHCIAEAEFLVQTEEPRDDDEAYTWMYLRESMVESVVRKGYVRPYANWIRKELDIETDVFIIDALLNIDPFLLGIVRRRIRQEIKGPD